MLWSAFIIGLMGSLHCAGMCGPLICAMPMNKKSGLTEINGLLLYNSGRIISYAFLGFLFGTVGYVVSKLMGEWFSYAGGIILIGIGLYKLISRKKQELKMPHFMRKWMGKLFRMKSCFALPFLGILNGLIPCGAVYAALAGAAATGDGFQSALYMLLFGLATWPAIFSSYYLTGKLMGFLRGVYRPVISIFLILMGGILLYRSAKVSTEYQTTPTSSAICK